MSKWLDHSSIVGKIGGYGDKYLNPISWITGGKSTTLTSQVLPEKVNAGLSTVMKPFDKVDQTVNPVRKIPIVNRVSNIVANKPGDALAIAAGAVFGGGALLGGGGAGGAGGAGGSGAGLTTSSGFGGVGTDGAATGFGGSGGGLSAGGFGGVGTDGAVSGVGEGGLAGSGAVPTADGGLVAESAPTTSSGFGGSGTDPSVTTSPDNGAALQQDQAAAPTNGQQQSQQQGQQQRKKRQPLGPAPQVGGPSEGQYQDAVNQAQGSIAQSSKTVKTRGATQAAMQRGLSGAHPVDTNGVHIAAIQELNKQIESLGAQIAACKAKRSAKGASA